MKTIILYATKYGATREIAQQIANNLPNSSIFDLKKDTVPPLSQYDCVIIGSSLYAGTIRKEAKNYVTQNATDLSTKKLGIYLSGMDSEQDKFLICIDNNFPKAIMQNAKAKAFLGGIYDPSKAGWFDRIIFKAVTKKAGYVNNILMDKIKEFVKELNA